MAQLPWQAEDVLAVLARFDLRPGRSVPVQALWHSIGRGKAVSEGVLQLVALRYVELNTAQTEVILTDLGYRVIRGENRGGEPGSTPQADPTLTASVLDSRRAVILTALEVETRAVLRHLHDVQEETVKQTVFHVGRFEGWEVAVGECGPGNVRTALIVERAIDHFSPEVACFVGVAGGVKDVTIGDVVVATKVYGYESGKDEEEGFRPRPEISLPAYVFEQRARALRLKDGWKARLDSRLNNGGAKIHVGPIAAGEKVVRSTRSATAKFLRAAYGDTLAVEMEGRGFLDGVHINHPVQGCLVRGISDLLDNKDQTDEAGSQAIAADAASAVTYEMLATLPPPGANLSSTRARPQQPAPTQTLPTGRPAGVTPAIYFELGDVLAEFGEPYDKVEFTCLDGTGFYLRVIPGVPLSKPLSRTTLGTIQDAGLFAMWRNPSGLFAQNHFGSIVVEPESPVGGDLKALSQLFANGELWGLARWLFVRNRREFGPIIPSKTLEQLYRDMLVRYINFLSTHLRIEPPLVIKAGVVGLKGSRLAVDADQLFGPYYDDALEATYVLNEFSPEAINAVLLQFFEALFAATGYERPKNLWNFPPG
jgi:nucleoside phosphorylase